MGWNTPTANLVAAYEPNDPRKAATILFSSQSDDAANGGYGKTVPPYTNALYWNKRPIHPMLKEPLQVIYMVHTL